MASNALATVLRDLEQRPAYEAEESTRLIALLGATDSRDLADLNRNLSEKIRSGEMTSETPGLIAHLKATTIAQVEIDQPRYSGLKTAKS